jgi:hypothetical protein
MGRNMGRQLSRLSARTVATKIAGMPRPHFQPMHYCTVVNRAYLSRLVVLFESMQRHCRPFTLHVLCWDVETYLALMMIDPQGVELKAYEASAWLQGNEELQLANLPGYPRTDVEWMWTVRSAFTAQRAIAGPVVQLDADMMFWSSPWAYLEAVQGLDCHVAVTPHWFARASDGLPGPTVESHGAYGRFNAGFVYLCTYALAKWWAERCREWCYHRIVKASGKTLYADQVYLEQMYSENRGVQLPPNFAPGPWCIHREPLADRMDCDIVDGRWTPRSGFQVRFGQWPLVAFHYHSMQIDDAGRVSRMAYQEYGVTEAQARVLYQPYVQRIEEAERRLRGDTPTTAGVCFKSNVVTTLRDLTGGEGGIRTPGTLASSTDFESAAIDHSATSPREANFIRPE